MNTKQVLIDARKLIEKPENWCQKHIAVDLLGRVVSPQDPNACAFCMVGALSKSLSPEKFVSNMYETPEYELLSNVAKTRNQNWLSELNDRSTHAEVLSAFDEAIANAND